MGLCFFVIYLERTNAIQEIYKARDGSEWKKLDQINVSRGRASLQNIIRHQPGCTSFIKRRVDNERDIFFELMSSEWIENIVTYSKKEAILQNDTDFCLEKGELVAFLGLTIIHGVLQGKNEPLSSFWDSEYGRNIFKETMSRDKYKKILKYLRFDDKQTRQRRRKGNKFAAISELWFSVIGRMKDFFYPNVDVTVDEQLFPCKSRCPFTQYMANKPDKFGLKFWFLCDLQTKFVLNAIPYTGRDESRSPSTGLAESVVLQLLQDYKGSGLCITMDNFFTSAELADKLLRDKITMIGTIRQNKKCIPNEIVSTMANKKSCRFLKLSLRVKLKVFDSVQGKKD